MDRTKYGRQAKGYSILTRNILGFPRKMCLSGSDRMESLLLYSLFVFLEPDVKPNIEKASKEQVWMCEKWTIDKDNLDLMIVGIKEILQRFLRMEDVLAAEIRYQNSCIHYVPGDYLFSYGEFWSSLNTTESRDGTITKEEKERRKYTHEEYLRRVLRKTEKYKEKQYAKYTNNHKN